VRKGAPFLSVDPRRKALAARTADYLIKQGNAIFFSNRRDQTEPGIHYDLSPRSTKFKGNPRIA
jgi:hypothetical protein